MAQLKVKQILDFVTAVAAQPVGTATGLAIIDAKSAASADATTKADTAETNAIAAAEAKDVVRAATAETNIAAAQAAAIASAEAKDVTRAATASTATATVASGLSSELVARAAADTLLDGKITTEKNRIDAILDASEADKNTFAEIVTLINSVDTANDTAFASYVLSNNAAVSALNGEVSTNASDIAVINVALDGFGDIVRSDVADFDAEGSAAAAQTAAAADATTKANAAQAAAISAAATDATTKANAAQAAAISAAATDATTKANAAQAAAISAAATDATTKADAAKAFATSADTALIAVLQAADAVIEGTVTALAGRVTTLEGLDVVQSVGTFVDATSFTLANTVATGDGNIAVFINGLQIHERFGAGDAAEGYTTDGKIFTLTNLGYDLEANDHIIVLGVRV